jgi:hypothetical protein
MDSAHHAQPRPHGHQLEAGPHPGHQCCRDGLPRQRQRAPGCGHPAVDPSRV